MILQNFAVFCQEELGPEVSDRLGLTESGCWPPWKIRYGWVVEDYGKRVNILWWTS